METRLQKYDLLEHNRHNQSNSHLVLNLRYPLFATYLGPNGAQEIDAENHDPGSPADEVDAAEQEQMPLLPLVDVLDRGPEMSGDLENLIELFDLEGSEDWCALDVELVEGVVQPQVRSRWLEVADQPVMPGSKRTVREIAFLVLDELKNNTTTFEATGRWLRLLAHAEVLPGHSGPSEANKWPPSLFVCRSLLSVPDLSEFEVHVCPEGCRFYFAKLSYPDMHLSACPGCRLCRCPLCGGQRYVKAGCRAIPASKCYFLRDVIQEWLLDADWTEQLCRSLTVCEDECAAWHASKEYARVDAVLDELIESGSTSDRSTQVCNDLEWRELNCFQVFVHA